MVALVGDGGGGRRGGVCLLRWRRGDTAATPVTNDFSDDVFSIVLFFWG